MSQDTTQLRERLEQALDIGKLLKVQSPEDWAKLVERVSETTGTKERIWPRYQTSEAGDLVGVYYLLPDREAPKSDNSSLEEAICYLAQASQGAGKDNQGFNRDDYHWGIALAEKLKGGYTLEEAEAREALQRIGKYSKNQLSPANLSLPVWEEVAHRYNSALKPIVVVRGRELGEPFSSIPKLRTALQQPVQPLHRHEMLLKQGELIAAIGKHFHSRNAELDGFDLIRTGATLAGAGLIALGKLEMVRTLRARRFLSDPSLDKAWDELEGVADGMDRLTPSVKQLLAARDEALPKSYQQISPSQVDRQQLATLTRWLGQQQSLLMEALDPQRMPEPIEVTPDNLGRSLQLLQKRLAELEKLIQEREVAERPIPSLEGAIGSEKLWERIRDYFKATRLIAGESFNPNGHYKQDGSQNRTLYWSPQGIKVVQGEATLLHLERDSKARLQVFGSLPHPELVSKLTNLPTDPAIIFRHQKEVALLQALQKTPFFSQGGKCEVKNSGYEFNFSPQENTCHVIIHKDNKTVWESQDTVLINKIPNEVLAQLADRFQRPISVSAKTHSTQAQSLSLTP